MAENSPRELLLRRWQIKFLFCYYFALVVFCSICSAAVFIPGPLSYFDFMGIAIVGSVSMACAGSAVYYFRKVYKTILQGTLKVSTDASDLKSVATFAYFLARPMFSIIFALIVVIGIRSGLALSGTKQVSVDYGFVHMTMFFSFFAGFLSGRFIRKLETWGESMIDRIAKEAKHGG